MALILTTPINHGSNTVIVNIPPITSTIVDSINMINLVHIKWIVDIRDDITGQPLTQIVLANIRNGIVQYTRYGLIGDLISHQLTVTSNLLQPTEILLTITNPSNNTYTVNITRE